MAADDAGNLVWTPHAGGLSRFSAILPISGVREALTYQDTSSLYYLTEFSEAGLMPYAWGGVSYNLSLVPNDSEFMVAWHLSPSIIGEVGVVDDAGHYQPAVKLHALFPAETGQLSGLDLSYDTSFEIGWQRAKLHLEEKAETLYYAAWGENNSVWMSLSYGVRYWDAIGDYNIAWSAGLVESNPYAGVRVEQNFDALDGYVGLMFQDSISPRVEFGVTLSFHTDAFGVWTLAGRSNSGKTALDNRSLGGVRRQALPVLWRRDVTLQRLQAVTSAGNSY